MRRAASGRQRRVVGQGDGPVIPGKEYWVRCRAFRYATGMVFFLKYLHWEWNCSFHCATYIDRKKNIRDATAIGSMRCPIYYFKQ